MLIARVSKGEPVLIGGTNVVLRGWQAKDVFLPDDYLIKQRFAGMTPAQIRKYAQRWQPWRSYALLHIWYTEGWTPSVDGEITGIQQ